MKQEIKQLSQIEHVLHRPSMYIGSIVKEKQEGFFLDEDKFKIQEKEYVPGLIKIFNEWIDNSVDEFVRTKGEFANKITIKVTDKYFECSDNGRGIPNTKMETLNGNKKYQAEVAFTEMLSGSNYENDDEATIGANGLGSKAGSIFAKKSIILNDDGKKLIKIETKDNLSTIKITEQSSKKQGVHVKVYPDLEYFGLTEIDQTIQDIIKERLLHLSIAYPGITFKFNSKVLKLNAKKYFEMFDIENILQLDNIVIGVSHSESDTFEHFSLVNGLVTKKGGTHINYITQSIVTPMRDKLVKKFKTIKPADIRNKLRVVVVFRNFMNARYTSQTKEEITNSISEISSYLSNLGTEKLQKFVNKLMKDQDVMLPITELFLLKEQAKANAEMKKLSKKKKIKSEKYLPATKRKKVLFLCEGASAVGGLMPSLGRDLYGYFELRGVPLNAYDSSHQKFSTNKELSELYQVIQNEDYEYICTATDSDADGSHIKGLLLGFFKKYLSELLDQNKFGELQTPVQAAIKNKKLQRWSYELGKGIELKKGEVGKYFKGLGSWNAKDLKHVVQTDGIENMINMFTIDDDKIIDNWLNSKMADIRKEYISMNEFDITGI
jgi:DNA gyrase/topoisomerase IV subunit B